MRPKIRNVPKSKIRRNLKLDTAAVPGATGNPARLAWRCVATQLQPQRCFTSHSLQVRISSTNTHELPAAGNGNCMTVCHSKLQLQRELQLFHMAVLFRETGLTLFPAVSTRATVCTSVLRSTPRKRNKYENIPSQRYRGSGRVPCNCLQLLP